MHRFSDAPGTGFCNLSDTASAGGNTSTSIANIRDYVFRLLHQCLLTTFRLPDNSLDFQEKIRCSSDDNNKRYSRDESIYLSDHEPCSIWLHAEISQKCASRQ